MSDKHIPVKDITCYGMLATPLAFASMPLYIHAPDYFATQFGVSLSLLAAILLALRFIDAIQDPFIGYLSDRYSAWREHIIIASSLTLIAAFTALFQPLYDSNIAIWFAVCILLSTTAYSILSINLNTIGGMWSSDKSEKTRIAGYREAFGLIGILLAVLLPSILQQFMPAPLAFWWVSCVLCFFILIALIVFLPWYISIKPSLISNIDTTAQPPRPLSQATYFLYGIYFISMLASSIPAILVLFFIRDRLDAEVYTGLFLALYFLAGAFGMPLWTYISKQIGKPYAWLIGMSLAIISFIWAVFLTPDIAWNFAIICILSGLALGADLALPPSILADQIHDEKREKHASYFFAILAFLTKSSLAIATITVLPMLDLYGFKPGEINSDTALYILSLSYAAIPCFIKFIAALLLWRSASILKNGAPHVQNNPDTAQRSHSYNRSTHHV